ncbi:TraI domain-containing protein [Citrobacter freundii]|uniref:TraI domain-containing protein n=1 Tax=Citrobacter freundii TaxID=546 RepID=UPI001C6783ED
MRIIWQRTSLYGALFTELHQIPARQFAELVQQLPTSEYHHHSHPGGRGIDSLCSPCGQIPRRLVICPTGCRRYSAHPWASPLRGQRMRCSKLLPAILCRTPVGGSHPPADVQYAKKKPVLAYELFLKYGGEGGLTRFARPYGAARSRCSRSVQLAAPLLGPSLGLAPTGPAHALFKIAPGNFVSNPGRGLSSPRRRAICEKKARTCVRALLKIWR